MGRMRSNFRVKLDKILGIGTKYISNPKVFYDKRKNGVRIKVYGFEATDKQLAAIKKLPHVVKVENWTPDRRSWEVRKYGNGGYGGVVIHLDTSSWEA